MRVPLHSTILRGALVGSEGASSLSTGKGTLCGQRKMIAKSTLAASSYLVFFLYFT